MPRLIVMLATTCLFAAMACPVAAQPPRNPPRRANPRQEARPKPGLGDFGTDAEDSAPRVQSPKPAKPPVPTVEKKLFTLYAIEFLVNDLAGHHGSLIELRSRLTYQRLLYDTLRREVDTYDDDGLSQAIRFYDARLTDGKRLADELYASLVRTNRALKQKFDEAQDRAIMNGLLFGAGSFASGGSDAEALRSGFVGFRDAAVQEQPRLRAARDEANKTSSDAVAAFFKEFRRVAERSLEDFKSAVSGARWKSAEFAFRSQSGASPSGSNPFAILKVPAGPGEQSPGVADLVRRAEACARAAHSVPEGAAFDQFRAILLGAAARQASLAAEKDLGATGLPTGGKRLPAGGELARDLWEECLAAEKLKAKIDDRIVRQAALAHAYAGDPEAGLKLITDRAADNSNRPFPRRRELFKPRPDFSVNPYFWFDAARISGAAGNDEFALRCMETAVKAGFTDREAALLSEDLQEMLGDPGLRRSFDALFARRRR